MTSKRDNFRLGLTIIAMFLLFFVTLLMIGGQGLSRAPMRPLVVRLVAGQGLPEIVKGSSVTCFGMHVGKVKFTEIIKDTEARPGHLQFLEVHAEVAAGLDLRADCQIEATGPPLGGSGALEIVNTGVDSEPLDSTLPLYAGIAGFQAVVTSISHELDEANPDGLITSLKRQLNPRARESIAARVHETVSNVNRIAERIAVELDAEQEERLLRKVHRSLDHIDAALVDMAAMLKENRPAIGRSVQSVEHALSTVDKQIVPSVARELDRTQPDSLVGQLHDAFGRLNRSLEDVNTITDTSKKTVVVSAARVDDIVGDASEAAALLRAGIKDISLHPWKLFQKPTDAEKRELHIFNIAREFSDAAASLDNATAQLKALADAYAGTIPADNATLARIHADLTASVEKFFKVEEALWRELEVK